jgi:hypothetical protein
MATKKSGGSKKARAAAKADGTAKAEAPVQADDSQALVVFAFRLTRAERDLIHRAAGSGRASSFVRGLAVAAANGDIEAVREIAQPQS